MYKIIFQTIIAGALTFPMIVNADSTIVDKLTVNGYNAEIEINGRGTRGLTLRPQAANQYSPIKWLDQQGNNVGMWVCHETNSSGSSHNHCSLYTAKEDRSKRTSRLDVEFGTDFSKMTFEDTYLEFKKGAYIVPVLRSPNGLLWNLKVDNNGQLSVKAH